MANNMAEKKRNTSRSQMAEAKVSGREKEQPVKSNKTPVTTKVATRDRGKTTRREQRGNSTWARFRNTAFGGFVVDSYYELRHKVTWPTFEQARNMTIAVIVISLAVGLFLGLVDLGLNQIFVLINGK
ncbi:hypothetical protein KSD_26570 [Ktedonobacter sp. SOSP1-85]|uniref:preprotein translocase subunit SecE n=1 Tax=Ktedonobacter sp. SOSP1-85 TaxID=2778367 RepID=UPI001914EF8D|nr:preprotein translocase subunit SecE [Ktedonobacter sp. SOSP1-85]GHO74886.1 hypothetical protein KSD_26570 [Ktedonobacter sp. SOSP1-85]